MKVISGRSSAVRGSATLVVDAAGAGGTMASSGFKFTSAMLTYFHQPITEIKGRSDDAQTRLAADLVPTVVRGAPYR